MGTIEVRMGLKRTLLAAALIACCAGCAGGAGSMSTTPGEANVTVLATSTGNDQVSAYDVVLESLTLTNATGGQVSLLPQKTHAEFGRLNGTAEPLTTVQIPAGTYTSATAAVGPAVFTCYGGSPTEGISTSIFLYGYTPDTNVSIALPSPIVIPAGSSALSLDLIMSKSASWGTPNCFTQVQKPSYSITPYFLLGSLPSGTPVRLTGLQGLIGSIAGAQTLTVTSIEGSGTATAPSGASETYSPPTWSLQLDASTAFQGVTGPSALQVGMLVDFDGTLQSDGSIQASRISVPDASPSKLSVSTGPMVVALSSGPILGTGSQVATGTMFGGNQIAYSPWATSFNNAQFLVSGEVTNLQKLPFAARFDGATLAAGQIISVTTHATAIQPAPIYLPATTITLLPQTINGTVEGIQTVGNFTVYTVQLASYDRFPQLANQALQTTTLTSPNTVQVYADQDAEMRNTSPIAVGSTARFHGPVFVDGGTLKMDCLWVADGVAN